MIFYDNIISAEINKFRLHLSLNRVAITLSVVFQKKDHGKWTLYFSQKILVGTIKIEVPH